jgi:hypothetical protein
MNYDLQQKAERLESTQHNHTDISILRYDQGKTYFWVNGTQDCQIVAIPPGTDPNIWGWLQSAQDVGPYSYNGQRCELWFSLNEQSTTLGCFAPDSVPLFMNLTMEGLPPNQLVFINFRIGSQSPALFKPPLFCPSKR